MSKKQLIEKLKTALPEGLPVDVIISLAPQSLWESSPENALAVALAASREIDCADYLDRYPDVAITGIDPLQHFARHGIHEGRSLKKAAASAPGLLRAPAQKAWPETSTSRSHGANREKFSARVDVEGAYSAIITLWKRRDYITEQYRALAHQSIPPREIIYIINGDHISSDTVIEATGPLARVLHSDINSLYTRFSFAGLARSPYVCVVDDDVIPGFFWMENAMRVCRQYNALAVASGRLYAPGALRGFFKVVGSVDKLDEGYISCARSDTYCDWGCNSYFFKREWIGHILSRPRYLDSWKSYDDIQLAASLFLGGGIPTVTPMQPSSDPRFCASLREKEYGADKYAIWKTSTDSHFINRKRYLEELITTGFVPVLQRNNLCRFHLIIDAAERGPAKCAIRTLKGQIHSNFICHLSGGKEALNLLKSEAGDDKRFRALPEGAAASPKALLQATMARPADIILYSEKAWLAGPGSLALLNRLYRTGEINGVANCVLSSSPGIDLRNARLERKKTGAGANSFQLSYNAVEGRLARLPFAALCGQPGAFSGNGVDAESLLCNSLQTFNRIESRPLACEATKRNAVVTIITPDHLADGLLCLESFRAWGQVSYDPFVFVTAKDAEKEWLNAFFSDSPVTPLFPGSLGPCAGYEKALSAKYKPGSDEYRWAMKPVMLLELLGKDYETALFLDPDIYVVADVTDMQIAIQSAPVSLFPHFRDPDGGYSRRVLYNDGFFNGGVIAATTGGRDAITGLYKRCLADMRKDSAARLYDDQKYLELIPLNVEKCHINRDRGLNYNPWINAPLCGWVSPSLDSLLLECGCFARLWHISKDMFKNPFKPDDTSHYIFRPIVLAYLDILCKTLFMLAIKAGGLLEVGACLIKRLEWASAILAQHASWLGAEKNIEMYRQFMHYGDIGKKLEQWTGLSHDTAAILASRVFSLILRDLFQDNPAALAIAAKWDAGEPENMVAKVSNGGKEGADDGFELSAHRIAMFKKLCGYFQN